MVKLRPIIYIEIMASKIKKLKADYKQTKREFKTSNS